MKPVGTSKQSASKRIQRSRRFVIGDRTVDLDAHLIVTTAGARIRLTRGECKLLDYLRSQNNQTVAVADLVRILWDDDSHRGAHSVRTVVKNVRLKLEPDRTQPRYLVVDRTFGYRLEIFD